MKQICAKPNEKYRVNFKGCGENKTVENKIRKNYH